MIPPDFIDELLSRTDIVEIIDARVKLKKTGQNHSGLCPFHNEKSPSFSVNGDKQFYYCFGCQASGSALKFLMEFDRMDFVTAVETLAARVGLEVPREEQSPQAVQMQQKRKSIYDVLQLVSDYYRAQLKNHPERDIAVSYLKGRGVSGKVARDYGLGFAPPGWDNLLKELAKTNHERDLLIDGGMVIDRPEEKKTYDRFRERIMFPIRDLRGRVIAFGGRIVGDGKPKYLNSPETPVFHKSRELYGLYEARQNNAKLEQLLVVEGYMDVVALAQHDVNFAVATLGTATTGEHLDRLFRMVSKVVFCFDGDTAGRNAGWKALQVALPYLRDGRAARFLFVPDGEDPDSLVRSEGKDKFLERLAQSQSLPDFFFSKLGSEVDLDELDGKAHLSQLAMPMINLIPTGVFKELMIGELSKITNLTNEKLLSLASTATESARASGMGQIKKTSVHVSPIDQENMAQDGPPPMVDLDGYSDIDSGNEYDEYIDSGFEPDIVVEASAMSKRALGILLLQPELSAQVSVEALADLALDPQSSLLAEVLKFILENDIRSPVLILSHFQNSSEFELLKSLAEKDHLLPPEDLAIEFIGILNLILTSRKEETDAGLRKRLLMKPFSDLTEEEKNQLRTLSASPSASRRGDH